MVIAGKQHKEASGRRIDPLPLCSPWLCSHMAAVPPVATSPSTSSNLLMRIGQGGGGWQNGPAPGHRAGVHLSLNPSLLLPCRAGSCWSDLRGPRAPPFSTLSD
jgi:hypothetical protein